MDCLYDFQSYAQNDGDFGLDLFTSGNGLELISTTSQSIQRRNENVTPIFEFNPPAAFEITL